METQVIDRKILPEPIFSYVQSEKIRIFEERGDSHRFPLDTSPKVSYIISTWG